MNPKLSSTVSVIKLGDKGIEFFKTNTRQSIRLKVEDDCIFNLVNTLDGCRSIEEIANEENISISSLNKLVNFCLSNGLLDTVNPKNDFAEYNSYRRVINFLSDYASDHTSLIAMWNSLKNSTVAVIGLGAVGSWVSCNLIQTSIKNIILMDNDIVEESNLHRQFGYNESDIGLKKIDALEKQLKNYNKNSNIIKIYEFLTTDTINILDKYHVDLIINCADKPNVDTTSLIIGEYGMKKNIPHIVGGGYNMHLSLIGQTILPKVSACVKCFEKTLEETNKIDKTRVKKLAIKNRKTGSIGPACAMIASMIGMEAIKVLTKCVLPSNINRRGEFNIFTMDIEYKSFNKRSDCEWCGKNGKYSCS